MEQTSILKIFASSTDTLDGKLLYEFIVEEARRSGLSGATVYRGIMGYGTSSKISSSKFWELTEKLPVSIEIIDTTVSLEKFYKHLEPQLLKMPKGCMVTIEPLSILLHKAGNKK